jgi:DHA3 family tetracycline resistance protein-like MFS transporter
VKTLPPTTIFYIRNGFGAFNSGLIFTAIFVYFARTIGMTPLQLSLMSVVHMGGHILFELPTGIVADVYSRKWSVIIGDVLVGLAFVLTGAAPVFAAVLAATFIEAIGDTFVSGALDAWLTDEVGADKMGAVVLRSEQLGAPVYWLGVGSSVALATLFNHQAPIVLGGALWLVASVVLMGLMPETGFVRRSDASATRSLRSGLRHMLGTFRDGARLIRARRSLVQLLVAQVFIGAVAGGFFGLNQLHLFTGFTLPVISLPILGPLDESAWVALMDGAGSLLYFAGLGLLRRVVNLTNGQGAPQALFALFLAIGVSMLAFALTRSSGVAVVALCAAATLHNLSETLLRPWLNQHIVSDVRATVLSINTQAHRLGMLGGGLSIGALGNVAGLRIALAAAALFVLPLLVLLRRESNLQSVPTREPNLEAHT